MKNLMKYQQEKSFTKPKAPTAAARKDNDLLVIVWKEELSRYHWEEKEYRDQKAKVFGVILGQCSREVKSRLESTPMFAETEQTNDVIGLLTMLKKMSHSTDGVQEPYWALQNVLRRLTAMNQGKHETVANYYNKFKNQAKVIAGQWGEFYPPNLTVSNSAADRKESQEKLLTMIFLAGACKHRFGTLKGNLNNNYLAGKDNYPATLQAAFNLLTHYQEPKEEGSKKRDDSYYSRRPEANFLQDNKSKKSTDDREPSPEHQKPKRENSKSGKGAAIGWTG
jgi:hypothetical protein